MEKPHYSGIYTITNIANGKIYIGQAIDIFDRWIEHKCSLRNQYFENDRLQKAWNKYGEESFKFEVLEQWDKEFLDSMEHYWCLLLKSHNRKYGYNLRPTHPNGKGGRGKGFKMSEDTKKKIFTQERANKISKSKLGVKRDRETKDKLSNYWKEKYNKGEVINPMQGKRQLQDTKDKIAKKARERIHKSTSTVYISNIKGDILETLSSTEAIQKYGTAIYYYARTNKIVKDKKFKIIKNGFKKYLS